MRDIALVALLPLLSYFAFKRPFIAAGLWLWTSAFNINALLYGFASSITYNRYFAGITILVYFTHKNKPKFSIDKLTALILFFFFWTTLSSFLSNGYMPVVWERWTLFMKMILFYLFSIAIVEKKHHIDYFIWVLILSIGILSAKEGTKFLISGGSHRISALPGIAGDNNFFALMILVLLPLSFYMVSQVKDKLVKQGLFYGIVFIILGLISTYSRAGFVGLGILMLFFLKASKNKMAWILVLSLVIGLGKGFMPEEWFNRMDTVENAEEDGSFIHRVVVWKMATVVAIRNPFFGEGFKGIEYNALWQKYAADFHLLDFIATPDVNYYEPVRAAHSIYFQVLCDHGFVGLFLFLLILLSAYLKLGSIKFRAKKQKMDPWVIQLAEMLRISLIVYCVSGGTVAAAYFDFIFAVLVLIYALDHRIVGEVQDTWHNTNTREEKNRR